jgi:glutathione S-transferase
MLPEDQRNPKAVADAKASFAQVAKVLSQALEGKAYLLGDKISAADIMVGSTLSWSQFMGLLDGQPVLEAYVARLSERPAFQRAQTD